jgi:hypothetical protein
MYIFALQKELVKFNAYVERRLDDVHEEILENQVGRVINVVMGLKHKRLVWREECSKDED